MSVTKWSETPPAPSRLAKVLVLLAAQFAGGLGRESIRLRQKNLSPERLQHRAPGFPRQRVVQRADALRRDDRDAAGLSGEGKKLLIAVGIVLPRGGEFVVLVADEEHLPPVAFGILLDLGNPVQHRPLAPVILNEVKNLRGSSQVPETKPTAVILRYAQDDSGKDFDQRSSGRP